MNINPLKRKFRKAESEPSTFRPAQHTPPPSSTPRAGELNIPSYAPQWSSGESSKSFASIRPPSFLSSATAPKRNCQSDSNHGGSYVFERRLETVDNLGTPYGISQWFAAGRDAPFDGLHLHSLEPPSKRSSQQPQPYIYDREVNKLSHGKHHDIPFEYTPALNRHDSGVELDTTENTKGNGDRDVRADPLSSIECSQYLYNSTETGLAAMGTQFEDLDETVVAKSEHISQPLCRRT